MKIIVYTDGGSRGNPGKAALGVVICDGKYAPIKRYSEYLGEKTNNEAEYEAMIFALKKIKALYGKERIKDLDIEIKSDSELMVKQLRGEYKILDKDVQSLFIQVWNLRVDFGKIKFTLIPREENRGADRLVNEALDDQGKIQTLDF